MGQADVGAFYRTKSFSDYQQEAEEFARKRALEQQDATIKRGMFDIEQQKFQMEKEAAANGGPFKGSSIESQMANALASKGYTPDQIAQMYYTKTVTLPGGGIAAITPQGRGLGTPTTTGSGGADQSISDLAAQIPGAIGELTGGQGVPANAPAPDPMKPGQMNSGVNVIVPPNTDGAAVPVNEEEARAAAAQLGVPYVPLNTRGIGGNQQAMLIRRAAEDARKSLESDDMQQSRTRATSNIQDSNRWLELQNEQKTGGWQSLPIIRGVSNYVDPQFSEMESISARLTPQQRVPSSGATSDFDAKMFQRATMGVDKPADTNRSIADAMRLAGQRELEYQDFMSKYAEINGTLDGAQQRWTDYSNKNPIFDPNSADFKINPSRITFQQYFGSGARTPTGMAAAPQNVQTQSGGWSIEEVR